MFVVSDYTFTPISTGVSQIVIPGVYGIERFAVIENATRNDVLFTASGEHLGSIAVTDDGLQTTVIVRNAEVGAVATDELRILLYYPTPTGGGPTANVEVQNWPVSQNVNGTVNVGNFPATQDVSGTVDVGNFPATQAVTQSTTPWTVDGAVTVSGSVDVNNFPATQPVSGTVSVDNFPATQPVSGTVDIGNLPAVQDVQVTNFPAIQTVSGTVGVNNFPAVQDVQVTNFPATQEVTQGTSPWVVSGTVNAQSTLQSFPATSTDAFGRLRISQPYTLFDSSTRYSANGQWSTQTLSGGTATFNSAQGLMDLSVTSTAGSLVRRETNKVFSYQPGKSLLLYTTFVMSGELGIRQSVGYYNDNNGYYVEQDETGVVSLVEQSSVSGGITVNAIPQSSWNIDPFDGTGPSGITLDFTKAQILWIDMEWLGVGTVRTGFVVDGQLLPAQYFQHANIVDSTYITTACLPFRYEIENISSAVGGTLKQICSTAISEGGYTLTGEQHSVSTPITAPYQLATAGTYYPVAALRLKSNRLDAISLVTGLTLLGAGNNETYAWRVVSRATVTGGTWDTVSATTPVEYNLTGTSSAGGTVVATGFTNASNQGSPIIDILKGSLFANQLERNPFTATPLEVVLEVAPANNTQEVFASINWEDVVL